MGNVKEETARGIKWGLVQKCTMQPVQFLYGIILARLISPDEMGILGLTAIFFAIAEILQRCGFGSALVRKQDRTDEDICTVFWFNVGMSFFLSSVLFLLAPWFVWFFDQPALLWLTRVSALLMFFNSTISVHMSLYQARRDFKTPAIVSMFTTLVAMPFTIWAAYSGWSYWAPMLQGIVSGILSQIVIWIVSPWRPRLVFSGKSFHEFFKYGINLVASGLFGVCYGHARTFIIGKFYSPAQLAFFTRGEHICSVPNSLIQGIIEPVSFPILATLQHDMARFKSVYQKYAKITSLLVNWLMITLAANSSSAIVFLYGARWEVAAEYAQIICLGWMFNPIQNLNSSVLNVLERTDLNLKIVMISRTVSIILMIIAACHSVAAICWVAVVSGFLGWAISALFVSKIGVLNMREALNTFMPYLILSIVVNVPAYFINLQLWNPGVQMVIGGAISACLYFAILWCKKDEVFNQLLSFALSKIKKGSAHEV